METLPEIRKGKIIKRLKDAKEEREAKETAKVADALATPSQMNEGTFDPEEDRLSVERDLSYVQGKILQDSDGEEEEALNQLPAELRMETRSLTTLVKNLLTLAQRYSSRSAVIHIPAVPKNYEESPREIRQAFLTDLERALLVLRFLIGDYIERKRNKEASIGNLVKGIGRTILGLLGFGQKESSRS